MKGKYRIQAVAEMTGVPAATLRAWERRYGLPAPDRTSSSYRLYSDGDVAVIRRLRTLCDAGMAPSEATAVVLAEMAEEAPSADELPDAYATVQARIVRAAEEFDPVAAETAVRQATVMGSATTVYERILVPAMRTVGDLWHAGDLSVAQEHMISRLVETAVMDMLRLVQPDDTDRGALVACIDEEQHVLPLYGVAFLLAEAGFRVTLLGARTPPAATAHAVSRLDPGLVALSATVAPEGAAAARLMREYGDACGHVPWVVGGRAAEALAKHVRKHGGEVVTPADTALTRGRIGAILAAHGRDRSRIH